MIHCPKHSVSARVGPVDVRPGLQTLAVSVFIVVVALARIEPQRAGNDRGKRGTERDTRALAEEHLVVGAQATAAGSLPRGHAGMLARRVMHWHMDVLGMGRCAD